jgi:Fic family protein
MSGPLADYIFDQAVNYHYGKFPPLKLDSAALLQPLTKASAALARYDATLANLPNKDLFLAPLRRQEAVISSRIEGTIASLDEVLKFEAEEEREAGRAMPRAEVLEVSSYIRALAHAQKLMDEGLPLCGRLMREAHSQLLFTGRGADKQPGQFKTEQNYVVDRARKKVLFVPISADKLAGGMAELEKFVNDESVEPLLQTAIAHVEFEALHPFKDGNGRLGRMLLTLSLWSRGLIGVPHFYVSSTIEERRDEYLDRLRLVSADDQWTEWCIFFLAVVEKQAFANLETAEKIRTLYEDMKERFRRELASQWSVTALDFIFGKPVFQNSTFTLHAGIPRPTAARFAKILSEKGLLTTIEPAAGRRPAIYAFEPLLQIVRA